MQVFRDADPVAAATQRVPSGAVARMAQVVAALYVHARQRCILQVEAFVQVRSVTFQKLPSRCTCLRCIL